MCVLGGGGGKKTSSSDFWFRLSPLNVVLCAYGGGVGGVFPRDNFHCMTCISAAILLRVLCASHALEFLTLYKPLTIPFFLFVLLEKKEGRYWHHPHFPDKETEAYREERSYPSWHSDTVSEPSQEMGLSCPVTRRS